MKSTQNNIKRIAILNNINYWTTVQKIDKVAPQIVASEIGNFGSSYIAEMLSNLENQNKIVADEARSNYLEWEKIRLFLILEFIVTYLCFIAVFYYSFKRKPIYFIACTLFPPLSIVLFLLKDKIFGKESVSVA